jgi:hypothetical protein
MNNEKRFWVCWWSGNYKDEGCTVPPFKVWVTDHRERPENGLVGEELAEYIELPNPEANKAYLRDFERDECSLVAVIDAKSEDAVWLLVKKHFPDFKERFCVLRDRDFVPGNKFR